MSYKIQEISKWLELSADPDSDKEDCSIKSFKTKWKSKYGYEDNSSELFSSSEGLSQYSLDLEEDSLRHSQDSVQRSSVLSEYNLSKCQSQPNLTTGSLCASIDDTCFEKCGDSNPNSRNFLQRRKDSYPNSSSLSSKVSVSKSTEKVCAGIDAKSQFSYSDFKKGKLGSTDKKSRKLENKFQERLNRPLTRAVVGYQEKLVEQQLAYEQSKRLPIQDSQPSNWKGKLKSKEINHQKIISGSKIPQYQNRTNDYPTTNESLADLEKEVNARFKSSRSDIEVLFEKVESKNSTLDQLPNTEFENLYDTKRKSKCVVNSKSFEDFSVTENIREPKFKCEKASSQSEINISNTKQDLAAVSLSSQPLSSERNIEVNVKNSLHRLRPVVEQYSLETDRNSYHEGKKHSTSLDSVKTSSYNPKISDSTVAFKEQKIRTTQVTDPTSKITIETAEFSEEVFKNSQQFFNQIDSFPEVECIENISDLERRSIDFSRRSSRGCQPLVSKTDTSLASKERKSVQNSFHSCLIVEENQVDLCPSTPTINLQQKLLDKSDNCTSLIMDVKKDSQTIDTTVDSESCDIKSPREINMEQSEAEFEALKEEDVTEMETTLVSSPSRTDNITVDNPDSKSNEKNQSNDEVLQQAIMEISSEFINGSLATGREVDEDSDSSHISSDFEGRRLKCSLVKYPENMSGLSDNDWNPYTTESDSNATPRRDPPEKLVKIPEHSKNEVHTSVHEQPDKEVDISSFSPQLSSSKFICLGNPEQSNKINDTGKNDTSANTTFSPILASSKTQKQEPISAYFPNQGYRLSCLAKSTSSTVSTPNNLSNKSLSSISEFSPQLSSTGLNATHMIQHANRFNVTLSDVSETAECKSLSFKELPQVEASTVVTDDQDGKQTEEENITLPESNITDETSDKNSEMVSGKFQDADCLPKINVESKEVGHKVSEKTLSASSSEPSPTSESMFLNNRVCIKSSEQICEEANRLLEDNFKLMQNPIPEAGNCEISENKSGLNTSFSKSLDDLTKDDAKKEESVKNFGSMDHLNDAKICRTNPRFLADVGEYLASFPTHKYTQSKNVSPRSSRTYFGSYTHDHFSTFDKSGDAKQKYSDDYLRTSSTRIENQCAEKSTEQRSELKKNDEEQITKDEEPRFTEGRNSRLSEDKQSQRPDGKISTDPPFRSLEYQKPTTSDFQRSSFSRDQPSMLSGNRQEDQKSQVVEDIQSKLSEETKGTLSETTKERFSDGGYKYVSSRTSGRLSQEMDRPRSLLSGGDQFSNGDKYLARDCKKTTSNFETNAKSDDAIKDNIGNNDQEINASELRASYQENMKKEKPLENSTKSISPPASPKMAMDYEKIHNDLKEIQKSLSNNKVSDISLKSSLDSGCYLGTQNTLPQENKVSSGMAPLTNMHSIAKEQQTSSDGESIDIVPSTTSSTPEKSKRLLWDYGADIGYDDTGLFVGRNSSGRTDIASDNALRPYRGVSEYNNRHGENSGYINRAQVEQNASNRIRYCSEGEETRTSSSSREGDGNISDKAESEVTLTEQDVDDHRHGLGDIRDANILQTIDQRHSVESRLAALRSQRQALEDRYRNPESTTTSRMLQMNAIPARSGDSFSTKVATILNKDKPMVQAESYLNDVINNEKALREQIFQKIFSNTTYPESKIPLDETSPSFTAAMDTVRRRLNLSNIRDDDTSIKPPIVPPLNLKLLTDVEPDITPSHLKKSPCKNLIQSLHYGTPKKHVVQCYPVYGFQKDDQQKSTDNKYETRPVREGPVIRSDDDPRNMWPPSGQVSSVTREFESLGESNVGDRSSASESNFRAIMNESATTVGSEGLSGLDISPSATDRRAAASPYRERNETSPDWEFQHPEIPGIVGPVRIKESSDHSTTELRQIELGTSPTSLEFVSPDSDSSGIKLKTKFRSYRTPIESDTTSIADSVTTMESTHTGSDDAVGPDLPKSSLGSRQEHKQTSVGIYSKQIHLTSSSFTEPALSTIEEKSIPDEKPSVEISREADRRESSLPYKKQEDNIDSGLYTLTHGSHMLESQTLPQGSTRGLIDSNEQVSQISNQGRESPLASETHRTIDQHSSRNVAEERNKSPEEQTRREREQQCPPTDHFSPQQSAHRSYEEMDTEISSQRSHQYDIRPQMYVDPRGRASPSDVRNMAQSKPQQTVGDHHKIFEERHATRNDRDVSPVAMDTRQSPSQQLYEQTEKSEDMRNRYAGPSNDITMKQTRKTERRRQSERQRPQYGHESTSEEEHLLGVEFAPLNVHAQALQRALEKELSQTHPQELSSVWERFSEISPSEAESQINPSQSVIYAKLVKHPTKQLVHQYFMERERSRQMLENEIAEQREHRNRHAPGRTKKSTSSEDALLNTASFEQMNESYAEILEALAAERAKRLHRETKAKSHSKTPTKQKQEKNSRTQASSSKKSKDSSELLYSIPEDYSYDKQGVLLGESNEEDINLSDPMSTLKNKIRRQRDKIEKERRRELKRMEKLWKLEQLLKAKKSGLIGNFVLANNMNSISSTSTAASMSESPDLLSGDSTLTLSAHSADVSEDMSTTIKDSSYEAYQVKVNRSQQRQADERYEAALRYLLSSGSSATLTDGEDSPSWLIKEEKKRKKLEKARGSKQKDAQKPVKLKEKGRKIVEARPKTQSSPYRVKDRKTKSPKKPESFEISPVKWDRESTRVSSPGKSSRSAALLKGLSKEISPVHATERSSRRQKNQSRVESDDHFRAHSSSPNRHHRSRGVQTSPKTRSRSCSPGYSDLQFITVPVFSSKKSKHSSRSGSYIPRGSNYDTRENSPPKRVRKREKAKPSVAWYVPLHEAKEKPNPLQERPPEKQTPKPPTRSEWEINGEYLQSPSPSRSWTFGEQPEQGKLNEDISQDIPTTKHTTITLQEALLKNKKDFISRSRERQKRIALAAEHRLMQDYLQLERDRIFGDRKRKGKKIEYPKGYKAETFCKLPRKKLFTKQEMKAITQRLYRRLPEVRYRELMEKRQQQYKLNRLRAMVFNRKVQNNVLRRAGVIA